MVNIKPNSGSDENSDPIDTKLNTDDTRENLNKQNMVNIKPNSGSDKNLDSGEKEFDEPICDLLQKLWDNLVDYFSELQTNWSESNNDMENKISIEVTSIEKQEEEKVQNQIDETLPNNEKNESLPKDITTLPYQESELKEPIQDPIEPVKEPIQDPIEPVKKPIQDPIEPVKKPNFFRRFGNFLKNIIRRKKPDE
jgi:hypothetical protein